MSLDPTEKGYRFKKEQMLKLVNLTDQQAQIIDIYLMEEQTGKRHWEWDKDDPNIYIEWLNGVAKLRSRINMLSNMNRRQKAMYNYGLAASKDGANGNNNQQKGKTLTTSSGRTITPETHPNLFKPHKRR